MLSGNRSNLTLAIGHLYLVFQPILFEMAVDSTEKLLV